MKGPHLNARIRIRDNDVLLAVDIQNDFCPSGRLAVPSGHEVIPVINSLAEAFEHVILTQDWHPADHLSFASSHPGGVPFQEIKVSYGSQILWPDHCVQGSRGAEFCDDLRVPRAELILRKGYRREIDSYYGACRISARTRLSARVPRRSSA
jgi:nicotinamidase/pyrazinamidase